MLKWHFLYYCVWAVIIIWLPDNWWVTFIYFNFNWVGFSLKVPYHAREWDLTLHISQMIYSQREWAEAKKELQQERDNVRSLTSDREQTLKNAMRQVEEMGKELANALHAVSAAETRAAVAEVLIVFKTVAYTSNFISFVIFCLFWLFN